MSLGSWGLRAFGMVFRILGFRPGDKKRRKIPVLVAPPAPKPVKDDTAE